jgi:hypothetical protein
LQYILATQECVNDCEKERFAPNFLKRFQEFYDDADNGIFTLDEWHDSFVFDAVRNTMKLNELDFLESKDNDLKKKEIRKGKNTAKYLNSIRDGIFNNLLKDEIIFYFVKIISILNLSFCFF